MGRVTDDIEDVGVPKSRLKDFWADIDGRLRLLTGQVDYTEFGLTLEDVRQPVLVLGQPGIGKTSGVVAAINEMNKVLPSDKRLGFKKIQLGQTVVGELNGIPVAVNGETVRVKMPDLPSVDKDGEYGVLFLDEITTADEMQIQPALGLCDSTRSIGVYRLPEHWLVIAAGNGPDCTNFIRLDDMTISRFAQVFDISYSYKDDFRPYAHATGLNEDIIAFLNFSPEACVRIESSDMNKAGKMFPCPRTWENLSKYMKMQAALGRKITADMMSNIAGRAVGIRTGREFGAFMAFSNNLKYDIDKILQGCERDPEVGMPKETYHIIIEHAIKKIKSELQKYERYNLESMDYEEMDGVVDDSTFERIGNFITWVLHFNEVENKVNTMIEIRNDLPVVAKMMLHPLFCEAVCPELDQFFCDYSSLLLNHIDDMSTLRF